jgi:hypothetical protein
MSVEKIGMRSGPFKHELVTLAPVNQKPIRLYMALAPAVPFSGQLVIVVLAFQRKATNQRSDNIAELAHVLAPLLLLLHVSLDCRSIDGDEGRWRNRRGNWSLGFVLGHA